MSSLKERIEVVEAHLTAVPTQIAVYHDLPFAIVRYDPNEEWQLRREVRLLATRLEEAGKTVCLVSLADLLWEAFDRVKSADEEEGLQAVVELERGEGFLAAQEQVTTYLSDRDWCPLADLLEEHLSGLDPSNSIAFLIRVAAMGPRIYEMSKLLDQMHGRTRVTTILFYPGSIQGTTGLRFMDLKDRDALGNYRVKIYG